MDGKLVWRRQARLDTDSNGCNSRTNPLHAHGKWCFIEVHKCPCICTRMNGLDLRHELVVCSREETPTEGCCIPFLTTAMKMDERLRSRKMGMRGELFREIAGECRRIALPSMIAERGDNFKAKWNELCTGVVGSSSCGIQGHSSHHSRTSSRSYSMGCEVREEQGRPPFRKWWCALSQMRRNRLASFEGSLWMATSTF